MWGRLGLLVWWSLSLLTFAPSLSHSVLSLNYVAPRSVFYRVEWNPSSVSISGLKTLDWETFFCRSILMLSMCLSSGLLVLLYWFVVIVVLDREVAGGSVFSYCLVNFRFKFFLFFFTVYRRMSGGDVSYFCLSQQQSPSPFGLYLILNNHWVKINVLLWCEHLICPTMSPTSLLPPLITSFFAGACFAGAAFALGCLSGWRLTLSTWGQTRPDCFRRLYGERTRLTRCLLPLTCLLPPCHHSSADMAGVAPTVSG